MKQVVRGTNTFHSVSLRSVLAKNRRLAGVVGEGGEAEDSTFVSMGEIGGSGEYEKEASWMMDFDQRNTNEHYPTATPVVIERITMWTILTVIILVVLWAIL